MPSHPPLDVSRRQACAALSVLGMAALTGAGAQAQGFPTRTVTLMVPFPPGSATDAIARVNQFEFAQRC